MRLYDLAETVDAQRDAALEAKLLDRDQTAWINRPPDDGLQLAA